MNTLHNTSSPPGVGLQDSLPDHDHHIINLLPLKEKIEGLSYPKTFALILITLWLLSSTAKWLTNGQRKKLTVPVYGYRLWFEPTFLLQARFVTSAKQLIHEAYTKMPNMPFVLKRYDADFLILPIRYLEELRLIPITKLSNKGANVSNLVPTYHNITFLLTNNLHVQVLRKKLTPELWKFMHLASIELAHGWDIALPASLFNSTPGNSSTPGSPGTTTSPSHEWTPLDFERTIRDLVARMTAKVFLGNPACRDQTWLDISVDFSIDLFTSSFTMKMFPPWLYGVVARLVPARGRVLGQLQAARGVVGAQMERYYKLKEKKRGRGEKEEEEGEEEDTLLGWMLENGKGSEVTVEEMSARQCVLTLASIHTTASQVANMMFDLCEHEEWWEVLRGEVDGIAKDLGPPGMVSGDRKDGEAIIKEWCARLEMMDSFFLETQRREPPILLGPQRLALTPLTLSTGLHIPAGTRVAFPLHEHQNDPLIYSNPSEFDPLRFYRKRHSAPDQRNFHLAGQTHPNVLGFGYGNQACPGRQFAVAEIKLIMARLLYEFEFKFVDDEKGGKGKGRRPRTRYVNEMAMNEWGVELLMRRRVRE